VYGTLSNMNLHIFKLLVLAAGEIKADYALACGNFRQGN
jgi:hypothetical protein